MARISFPKNLLLKCWIFWIIVECTFKIFYEMKSPTKFQELEDFFHGLILPWFSGAIWSDFKLLSYGIIAVHIYIVLVILFQNYNLIKNVITWVWIMFWLAMFTIWVEPWITLFTHKSPEALLSITFFKEILFVVDVTFSLLWLGLTYIICQLLDKEF
ncbi:hypothetical protein PI95_032455 [Hassallia byssoidea VB512170]|uniref:Transmembrane protein n=2 Tax=Hassallia TaxID=482629 RepID=A0A846HHT5_9CYAN|nr:hypothetical protein [Hassalia byssoidea VB512170]